MDKWVQNRNSSLDVPQCLDNRRGVRTMKEIRLKVEIAQQALSDLRRGWHVNMLHASRKPFDL